MAASGAAGRRLAAVRSTKSAGCTWWRYQWGPGDTFSYTAAHKSQHEIEQIEYLIDQNLLSESYRDEADKYRCPQSRCSKGNGQMAISPLTCGDTSDISGTYNRTIYQSPRGKAFDQALNPGIEWQRVVAQSQDNAPGITWVNDLLRAEVQEEL